MYRQAALLLHPDRTLDMDEKQTRHRLMAEVNEAYSQGDVERIRAILREWHDSPHSVQGSGPGAELIRIIRMIAQVEKRFEAISKEVARHRSGELFKLKEEVEAAREKGRDLLKSLCDRVEVKISKARAELKRVA